MNRPLRTTIVLSTALAFAISGLLPMFASADSNTTVANSPLVISEVQTGGCVTEGQLACTGSAKDATKEFIELYNQQNDALNVHGWQVQYLSNGGSPATLATLDGTIAGHSWMLLAFNGYLTENAQLSFSGSSSFGALAEGGGHVQVVDATNQLYDRVGWGTATQPLTKSVKAPTAGRSIQRISLDESALANSGNNSQDFTISDTPSPRGGGYTAIPVQEPTPEPTPDPTQPSTPTQTSTCEGVTISEILPNPAGADSGHEFIELHNPTNEVISLKGCSLQTGNKASYTFPDLSLQPSEYHSFSDTESKLTLANSAGGTVWLLSPTDELQTVAYPADLPDDVSWALVDGSWAKTYTPTPGTANLLTASEPCPAGQERNSETNRCQNIDTAASIATATTTATAPTPCKAGQERNPATNRCRNITTTGSTAPTPCKAGQERNPETNRCKAIAAGTTTAKACPAGQERNAETNRCRKVTAASGGSIAKVQDVKAPVTASHGRLLLVVVAVVLAIGYAVYEWRQEIAEKLNQLFGKRPLANPQRI